MTPSTRVALVLGSGGARGYAHIGVIEVLEQRGYDIVAIAGTSMGALVGGLHAAGRLDAYAQWARTLTKNDVWRLLDPALRAPGAIRATRIFAKVTELVGDTGIEDLPISYTAGATSRSRPSRGPWPVPGSPATHPTSSSRSRAWLPTPSISIVRAR